MPTRPWDATTARRKRARTRRVLASATVASGLLLLGHAVSGAENDATAVEAADSSSLIDQAIALGLLDASDLAPASAEVATAVPTVTSVVPNAGPTDGGQIVVITGTGFTTTTGADTVVFGANNATNYAVVSSTKIVATVPDGTGGVAAVKVKNADGTNTNTINYTYGAPTVTGVSPNFATESTTKVVTITGTGFLGAVAADVKFGDDAAKQIWVVSDTQIIAETPIDDTTPDPDIVVDNGEVDVKVTRGGIDSATSANTKFVFTPGAPTVTSLDKTSTAAAAVGADVVLTGTNLYAVKKVNFGTTAVTTNITLTSATSITVKVPARTTSGPVDITVENAAGTSSPGLGTKFSYITVANPTVTAVTPNLLDKATGGSFLLTGTNFSGATDDTVILDCKSAADGTTATDAAVTTVAVLSDTQMIVTAGASKVSSTNTAANCTLEVQNAADITKKVTLASGAIKYL